MRQLPYADAVALGQVLAKNAAKRAVDENHPHLAQRVGQHQALAALHELAHVEAHRGPGGREHVFHALRVEDDAVGQAFFGPLPAAHVRAGAGPLPRAIGIPLGKVLTVPKGGKSPGKYCHMHSFLSTYKMAFTTSTSGHLPRRRTASSGSNCCQSRG